MRAPAQRWTNLFRGDDEPARPRRGELSCAFSRSLWRRALRNRHRRRLVRHNSREDVSPLHIRIKGRHDSFWPDHGVLRPFPLVVFSHGLGRCGIHEIFFTERSPVTAMSSSRPTIATRCAAWRERDPLRPHRGDERPCRDAAAWNHNSHVDRRNDIGTILNTMLGESAWKNWVAADRIGIVGHSVGGYVTLGMVGGWKEWNDPRIKVALLFSPYSLPFRSGALCTPSACP